MTSDKQVQANQRNARNSTGPRTPEGKAAVRHNALLHGLLSREVLLPGEDYATLNELYKRLSSELKPVGELENLLVDKITATHWRLRRLGRVEADLFNPASYQGIGLGLQSIAYNTSPGSTFTRDANGANAFSKLSRYETALERSLYRALHELQRLQSARRTEGSVPPPVAVDVEVSGVSREDLENGFVS